MDSHVCVPTSKGNREYFLQQTLSFKPNISINCLFAPKKGFTTVLTATSVNGYAKHKEFAMFVCGSDIK